jgi:rhodanese-related sulfurtransferase
MHEASSPKVRALTPEQAWQMLHDDTRALLIDIRSTMEFLFVGHPKGALHIPWIDEPEWTEDPHFVTHIREVLLGGAEEVGDAGPAPVILICRSGRRSLHAAQTLIASGITNVYHIDEGFEGELDEEHHRNTLGGWRYHGLPWEQC